jgi:DNA-binding transcriptional LysR family regulator
VASPAYLAARGRPATPDELEGHSLILGMDGAAPERAWPLLAGGSVRVTGAMVTNDVGLRRSAARDGFGIALAPIPSVRDDLQAGTLEMVLPHVVGVEAWLSVVYPERAFVQPKVRAFVDHLLTWAASLPPDPCAQRGRARYSQVPADASHANETPSP